MSTVKSNADSASKKELAEIKEDTVFRMGHGGMTDSGVNAWRGRRAGIRRVHDVGWKGWRMRASTGPERTCMGGR